MRWDALTAGEGEGMQRARIQFLDGLRGIAIILVVLFHAYSRWPNHVPFGDRYAHFPLFEFGLYGVELFFLISGFVILMTLEKCRTLTEFLWRRWVRFFPAMLICSLIIYFAAYLFPQRPEGPVSYIDFLPGLTFIDPVWWRKIGLNVVALDGAFWSLFVEMAFYIVFGSLYFVVGESVAIICLFSVSLPHIIKAIIIANNSPNALGYFSWFAAGALSYKYWTTKDRRVLATAFGIASLSAYTIGWTPGGRIVAEMIATLFFASLVSQALQKMLTNPESSSSAS